MTSTAITNSDDVIDSRDVIERIKELNEQAHFEISLDEIDELGALVKLDNEGRDASEDWEDGATLIRDTYFKDYAMELAENIGDPEKDYGWPQNCIDWNQAARELQMDYTSIEFDGVDYWTR